jgi:glucose/mannose-6-phosphate isomerase
MGGSGIAGDYVKAVTSESTVQVVGHKDYGPLPGWTEESRPLVIGVSYSGNTEETLDVVSTARDSGLDVVVLTTGGKLQAMAEANDWPIVSVPGGLQPRAALGYLFGAALRVVGEAGGITTFADDLDEAANLADEITTEDSSEWTLAGEIAASLIDRIAIVYGGGLLSATVAQRWKTQINENAKMPAWWSTLPELDHNEIVGWETLPELTEPRVAIVSVADRTDHARVASRYQFTKDLTEDAVSWAGRVESRGESAAARIISLTAVGDLMSWMLAEKAGVDPVPVGTIEDLKKLLSKSEETE